MKYENINDFVDALRAQNEEEMNCEYEILLATLGRKTSRLAAKKQQIEDLEYEKDLIMLDITNYIKNKVNGSRFNLFAYTNSDVLYKAWKYSGFHNHNKSGWEDKPKEEQDDYKITYDFVVRTIMRAFELDEGLFKIIEICNYNYSQGYEFTFEYKIPDCDKTIIIQIQIPVFSSVTLENYQYLLNGYRVSWQESAHVYASVSYGLDYRKVAKDLHDFLERKSAEVLHSDNINFIKGSGCGHCVSENKTKEANQDEVHN